MRFPKFICRVGDRQEEELNMDMILYGGDATKLEEICLGDIVTPELIHEACSKVWDGKNKIKISFPKQLLNHLNKYEFLVPHEVEITDKSIKFVGKNIVDFNIFEGEEFIVETDYKVSCFKTIVTCGTNVIVIITAKD